MKRETEPSKWREGEREREREVSEEEQIQIQIEIEIQESQAVVRLLANTQPLTEKTSESLLRLSIDLWFFGKMKNENRSQH